MLESRAVRILHVVPGLEVAGNGIAVAAKLIAEGQRRDGHEVELMETRNFALVSNRPSFRSSPVIVEPDEVWVHSMWLPMTVKACKMVLRAGRPLVRMTHANLDPLRVRLGGWKKLPVWHLLERKLFARAVRVVVTCPAEADWCRRWGVTGPFEVIDLKRCFRFDLDAVENAARMLRTRPTSAPLHVLYLGRPHPLKGIEFLKRAVDELNQNKPSVRLRIVCNHTGAELEADWAWADVLCLPTLSENFGLVVAEALVRGKPVITTDGAPAWEGQEGVIYLKGYRDGDSVIRVKLLRDALRGVLGQQGASLSKVE